MSGSKGGRTHRPTGKGGPRRRRKSKSKSDGTLAIIDRLLLGKVRSNLNGADQEITALEAIVYQLIKKEAAGDSRAAGVLLKYEELLKRDSNTPLQMTFLASDYTRTLAETRPEAVHG